MIHIDQVQYNGKMLRVTQGPQFDPMSFTKPHYFGLAVGEDGSKYVLHWSLPEIPLDQAWGQSMEDTEDRQPQPDDCDWSNPEIFRVEHSESPPLNAFDFGTLAFYHNQPAEPGRDWRFMETIEGLAVDETIKPLEEWARGWHEARRRKNIANRFLNERHS